MEQRGQCGQHPRSAQFANLRVQTTLVAGGLVPVNQTTTGVAIHQRLSGAKSSCGSGLVFGLDSLNDFLEGAANHGAGAAMPQATMLGLTRTLLCRLDISQGSTPETDVQ